MKQLYQLSLLSLVFLIASCGGSGGSTSTSSTSTSNSLVIPGVALTGAAIAGGTIEVKCKTGTGTAVSSSDGSFSVSVSNGAKPCLLRVTDPISKTVMHSLLESNAASNIANISPVTDLVVANTLGQTPATAFTVFDATIQEKIKTSNIDAAVEVVKAATAAMGADADMSGVDILKGSIVAKQGEKSGDATDKKIDALMAALASADKKISELSEQLKNASTTTAASSLTSLIGDSLYSLSGCPAARSGEIWTVDFKGGEPILWKLDFVNNKIKNTSSNTESNISPTQKNGATVKCGFEANINMGAGSELIKFRVSDGGVASWTNGTSRFGLSVPKQTSRKPDINDFGGTFPAMFFINKNSTTRTTGILKYTINDAGISVNYCNVSETAPNCTGTLPASSVKQICEYETIGYMSCHTADNKILSKAVMYINGGQSIMLWSISKFPINTSSGSCSVGGSCESLSNTYDGYGLIIMTKENSLQMPALGTLSKTGSYIQYKKDGTLNVSDNGTFGEVTKVESSKNYFETYITVDNFSGTVKNYINSPSNGFRFSVIGNYQTVYMGAPSGWLVSSSGNSTSTDADWLIGIRDSQ